MQRVLPIHKESWFLLFTNKFLGSTESTNKKNSKLTKTLYLVKVRKYVLIIVYGYGIMRKSKTHLSHVYKLFNLICYSYNYRILKK